MLTNCASTCLYFLMCFDLVPASVAMTAILSRHFNSSMTDNKRRPRDQDQEDLQSFEREREREEE